MEESSMRDISQLVQAKERELHEMHELRCLQLEKMIEERDGLLQESTRRYDLLREDFQYNLSLLEARDKEIGRLNLVTVKLEASEHEKENLTKRLEMMLVKECEKEDKAQHDKLMNKKILNELQDEVEALRWSTADELKSKTREIELSRQEMKRVQGERDNSLECQRIELTELYENMLRDRENTFLKQEENICHQVQLLEKRFQSLTNENTRLKSEGAHLQRTCEKLTNELATKEERCNQLMWQVDDHARKLQDTEDTLCKKLQVTETENQNYVDSLERMTVDHKRDLDKVKSDLKREREFTSLKTKHWEEHHTKNINEIEKLTMSLEEVKNRESSTSKELESARDKTRNFGIKELELNTVIANQKQQLDLTDHSMTTLQEEIQELRMKYTHLSDSYECLENSSKSQITKATEHVQGMQTDMAVMRANLQAEHIMIQQESEQSLQKEINTLQTQYDNTQKTLEDRDAECRELSKLLEDERAEGDAMRLRLTLHASTNPPPNLNPHNHPHNVQSNTKSSSVSDSIPRLHIPSHLQAASSPMFSEDFGTVSIPGSPMNFKSPYFHPGESFSRGDGGFNASFGLDDQHRDSFPKHQYLQDSHKIAQSKDDLDLLSLSPTTRGTDAFSARKNTFAITSDGETGDNRRLKIIIKEMRRDAEALFAEMQKAVSEKEKASEQVLKLEERLLHATLEVNKLREERRKLMDVNNELRAAAHQRHIKKDSEDEQPKENNSDNPDNNNNDNNADLSLYIRGYANEVPSRARASDRQTKSQQEALQKLKDKSMHTQAHMQSGRGGGSRRYDSHSNGNTSSSIPVPNRKVVNYANQQDFQQI